MTIYVTDILTVETKIPLKLILNFAFEWCLDEHATLSVTGTLDTDQDANSIHRGYKGFEIKAILNETVIFSGFVTETLVSASGYYNQITIKAFSATELLDRDLHSEMFQDTSSTYKEMICKLLSKQSGELIFTVNDREIEKPLLCYQESIWHYVKRMASHFHSHVIADVKTGRPAFWFGLYDGRSEEMPRLTCTQVEVKRFLHISQKTMEIFTLIGSENYNLCDKILYEGAWLTIYKKYICLVQGELVFCYSATDEQSLNQVPIEHQKSVNGLSLKGKVEKVDGEFLYVRLDIDCKPGCYAFPWYSETGTCLYAMPEVGTTVEIYFAGENDLMAVRCRDADGIDSSSKKVKLPDGAEVYLNSSELVFDIGERLSLADHNIGFSGNGEINITASKKVKISSKVVEMYAEDEINYVTEW